MNRPLREQGVRTSEPCQDGHSCCRAVRRLLIAAVVLVVGPAHAFWFQSSVLSKQKAWEACTKWASKGGYWKYRSTIPNDTFHGFSVPKLHCSNYMKERTIKGREVQLWYINAPCHNVALDCPTWDPRSNNPSSYKVIKSWKYR